MRLPALRLACLALVLGGAFTAALGDGEEADPAPFAEVDFAEVPRTIGPEPEYVAEPRYALFLFGPRGETRRWAVLDRTAADLEHHDVLYFDRDGDGDLTDPQERFEGTFDERRAPAGMALTIRVGDVPVPGTDLVHRDLIVSTIRKPGRTGIWFKMRWNGEVEVSGGTTTRGDATAWGATPARAPILRPTPRGRLAFRFYGWGAREVTLPVGGERKVYLMVGKEGSAPDAFCVMSETFLDEEADRIHALLIASDAQGGEVRVETEIRGHC